MTTTYSCDRCKAPMGAKAYADLFASLGEGVRVEIDARLTGGEGKIEAELCKPCFIALKDWLAGAVTPEIGPHVPKTVPAEFIPPVPKGPLPTR